MKWRKDMLWNATKKSRHLLKKEKKNGKSFENRDLKKSRLLDIYIYIFVFVS